MDVREKLIELLCNLPTPEFVIGTRRAGKKLITAGFIADHLIANGVTVQENVEISDELLKQLKNAPITICKEEPSIELVQEWISVEDRLPEDSANVLVCHKNGLVTTNAWLGANWWFKNERNPITHWMPMPQPPKGE